MSYGNSKHARRPDPVRGRNDDAQRRGYRADNNISRHPSRANNRPREEFAPADTGGYSRHSSKYSKSNRRKGAFHRIAIPVFAVAILLLLVFIIARPVFHETSVEPSSEYLVSLESGDVDAVNKEVRAVRDSVNKELGLDEASEVWVELEDCVFMGDSRVVGYEAYEFVPSDRVFAFAGAHITDARDSAEKVGNMRPEIIFVAYGLNDIGIGLWPKAEDYAAETVKTIEVLQSASPGSAIVVSSVLPAVGPGLNADPNYPRIPEYNDALAAALKDMKGVVYVDCTNVAKENENLYAEDGLHLQQDMYPLWISAQYQAYEERS